jgi:eukaryotic-like serine/threonine-protein kinase
MSLVPGTRIGPYEVVAALGAGGMGEVYRARDARLGRDVAVKVLPVSFASDEERLRRFEQEARAIGALNHPNILGVYDVGSHAGAPYVVSELLDGDTLRERIGTSPLPQRKAIEYAAQMARGMAAAHDKGIIHRDLKPDNVFVTRDGRVKILDFGLAKVAQPGSPIEAETALAAGAAPQTAAGTVMGTVGYMSPEQVRGQSLDHRSDIFSFGVVLYEMLTGRRAFQGDSAVETMNAILKEDPAPAGDVHALPPALDRIVLHCLEKNPEERFQSARDIAFDIESLSGLSAQAGFPAAPPARARWLRPVAIAILAASVGTALFVAGRTTARQTSARFQPLTFRRGSVTFARFAPDGRTIVYAANWEGGPLELYTTQPGTPESRPLGLRADLQAVSSRGEMAVLLERPGTEGVLARVPIGGGAPREVLENVRSADWDPDGEALAVVRTQGGRDTIEFPIGKVLYQAHGWLSDVAVSPKGDRVAFAEHPIQIDNRGDVVVVDLAGTRTAISNGWEDIFGLHWTPRGDEVWFSASGGAEKTAGTDHAIFAATLAGRVRTVMSAPGSLDLEDIAPDGRALVAHGTRRPVMMALAPGAADETELTWMDFSWIGDISPDGTKVLFGEQGVAGGAGYAVYLRGMDRSPAVRLGKGMVQSLSPDGRWALSIDLVQNVLFALPTGAGEPRSVASRGMKAFSWAGWFPDGKRVLFAAFEEGKGQRMYAQDAAGGNPKPLTPEGVAERANTLSPDGKWVVARQEDRLLRFPVDGGGTPQPFPGTTGKDAPLGWRADGGALYVRNGRLPALIFAVDSASGQRTLVRTINPRDTVGVNAIGDIRLTPDAKAYGYVYVRSLYSLYEVTGLE